MAEHSDTLGNILRTGAVATVATTLAVAYRGRVENENALGPLNAVSHIAWGTRAAFQDEASVKYTGTGLLLNAVAVTSWAAAYELFFGRAADRKDVPLALLGGAIVSAAAYVTDYHIVPERLTPGFEKRLTNRSLFGIYAVLAASLALGSLCRRSRSRSSE